jgi:hypothetical protein
MNGDFLGNAVVPTENLLQCHFIVTHSTLTVLSWNPSFGSENPLVFGFDRVIAQTANRWLTKLGASGSFPGQVTWDICELLLCQVSSECFSFPWKFSFHRIPHNHLSSGTGIIGPVVAGLRGGLSDPTP